MYMYRVMLPLETAVFGCLKYVFWRGAVDFNFGGSLPPRAKSFFVMLETFFAFCKYRAQPLFVARAGWAIRGAGVFFKSHASPDPVPHRTTRHAGAVFPRADLAARVRVHRGTEVDGTAADVFLAARRRVARPGETAWGSRAVDKPDAERGAGHAHGRRRPLQRLLRAGPRSRGEAWTSGGRRRRRGSPVSTVSAPPSSWRRCT